MEGVRAGKDLKLGDVEGRAQLPRMWRGPLLGRAWLDDPCFGRVWLPSELEEHLSCRRPRLSLCAGLQEATDEAKLQVGCACCRRSSFERLRVRMGALRSPFAGSKGILASAWSEAPSLLAWAPFLCLRGRRGLTSCRQSRRLGASAVAVRLLSGPSAMKPGAAAKLPCAPLLW